MTDLHWSSSSAEGDQFKTEDVVSGKAKALVARISTLERAKKSQRNNKAKEEKGKSIVQHLSEENLISEPPLRPLCEKCSSITMAELGNKNGVAHLDNVWELPDSAKSCQLCVLILIAIIRAYAKRPGNPKLTCKAPDIHLKKCLEPFGILPTQKIGLVLFINEAYLFSGCVHIRFDGIEAKHVPRLRIFSTPNSHRARVGKEKPSELSFIASSVLSGIPVPSFPDIAALSIIIRNWLKVCTETHHLCRNEQDISPQKLPTRVIDVSTLGTEAVRLVDFSKACGQYVTLSHCWGGSQSLRTTKSSLKQHYESILISNLPTTFRDAVQVTRCIGVQYLWIDSLTIIQDDAEDWKREGSKMGDIYSNSYVTIAASRASSTADGFLGSRNVSEAVRIPLSKVDPKLDAKKIFVDAMLPSDDSNVGALSSRGWVLQESVLSPRTIYFTRTQVYWECWEDGQGEHLMEALYNLRQGKKRRYPSILAPGRMNDGIDMSDFLDWYKLLEDYTARNLTYHSDKLMAIDGIMKRFEHHILDSYVYGIWKRRYYRCLLWCARTESLTYNENTSIPSWSWASRIGPITHIYFYKEMTTSKSVRLVNDSSASPSLLCRICRAKNLVFAKSPHLALQSRETKTWRRSIWAASRDKAEIGWCIMDREDGLEFDWASLRWALVAREQDYGSCQDRLFLYLLVKYSASRKGFVRVGVAGIVQAGHLLPEENEIELK